MFGRRDGKKAGGAAIASQARNMAKKLVFTHAVPVDLFLYNQETASYKTVGRIGAGILGNQLVRQFNIIFYYTPQKVLALCPITEEMSLVVQNSVYVNFTDDKRQQWSVQFASAEALEAFMSHYAIARISLFPSKAYHVDLNSGTGNALKAGDIAGVEYSLYQEKDAKLGRTVEQKGSGKKPHRVTVGQSTLVKSFDDCLEGMCKESKRVLAVPSALAYGSKGSTLREIPPETSLVFVVEVHRLKHMNESASSKESKSATSSLASTTASGSSLGGLFGTSSASLFSSEGPADLPSMSGSLSLRPKDPPKEAEELPNLDEEEKMEPKEKSGNSLFEDDSAELFSSTNKDAEPRATQVDAVPASAPASSQPIQQAPLAVYNPLNQQSSYSNSAPSVAFQDTDAAVQAKMDEIYQLRKQLNEVRDAKLQVEEERFAAKEQHSRSKRKLLQMEIQMQELQEELEKAKKARMAPPPQAATNLEHLEALKQNHKHELQEQRLKLKEQYEQDLHTALHQQKAQLKKDFKEQLAEKEKQAAAAYQMGMRKGKAQVSENKAGVLDEEAEMETTRTIIKSVKGVMSSVFVSVKASLDPSETYDGAEVLGKLVESLRASTFAAVKQLEDEAREKQAARELEAQEMADLDEVLSDLSIDDADLEGISDFELSDEDI